MQSTAKCLLLLCLTASSLSEKRDKRHPYHLESIPYEANYFNVISDLADEAAAIQNQAYYDYQAAYHSQVPYYYNQQNCDHPAHQQSQTIYYAQPEVPVNYPVLYAQPEYYPVADIAQPCPETAEVIEADFPAVDLYPDIELGHQTYPDADIVVEAEPRPETAPAAPPCPHAEKVIEKETEEAPEPVTEVVPVPTPLVLPCPHAKPVHKVIETGPTEATVALVSSHVGAKIVGDKISAAEGAQNVFQSGFLNVGTLLIPEISKEPAKFPAPPSVITYEKVSPPKFEGYGQAFGAFEIGNTSPVPPVSVIFEQEIPTPKPTSFRPDIIIQKVDHDIIPIREHILDHSSSGGYSYHQINKDGTVTTYGNKGMESDIKLETAAVESHTVKNKKPCKKTQHGGSEISTKPCEKPKSKTPDSIASDKVAVLQPPKNVATESYAYHQINQDGTVTSYTNNNESPSGNINIPHKINKEEEYGTIISQDHHNKKPVIHDVNEKGFGSVGGYIYNQINQDGTVTTYTQGNSVETISENVHKPSPALNDQIIKESKNQELQNTYSAGEGLVYHQINQDGTVTTYSRGHYKENSGNVNVPSSEFKKEQVFYETSTLVPASIVTEVYPGQHETGGYTYNQVNQDGTLSTFSKGSHYKTQSSISATPAPAINQKASNAAGGYVYKQINQDGTVTSYQGNSVDTISGTVNALSPIASKIPPKTIQNVEKSKQSIHQVDQNSFNSAGGYVYHQVNQDGTVTSYSQGNAVDTISGSVKAPSIGSNIPTKPIQAVEKSKPAIHHVDQNSFNSPGGYVYHQVNQDGTITSFSGGNNVETVNIPPQVITKEHKISIVSSTLAPPVPSKSNVAAKVQESSKASGSYVYHQSNNDGTFTTYSGGNVEGKAKKSGEKKITCTKKPCAQSLKVESNGYEQYKTDESDAPRLSQLVSDKYLGGFRYQQVHSGGFTGSPAPEFESITGPSIDTLVIGRIHKIIDTVPNGKLPIDENKVNHATGFDADRTNYFYKQSYADGTEQTFIASDDINTASHNVRVEASTAKAVYSSYGIRGTENPSSYHNAHREDRVNYRSSTERVTASNVITAGGKQDSPPSYIYRQVVSGAPKGQDTVVDIDQSYNPPLKVPHTAQGGSLKANPIVVPEDSVYSFQQVRGDGSAYAVRGDRDGSVVVSENDGHRGDIGTLH